MESNGQSYQPITPPHSMDAEKSVLGAVLINKEAAETAVDILRPEDFYYPEHSTIFQAMVNLSLRGNPIDSVTLMNMLESMGKLGEVGGMAYITELSLYTPSAANVRYYADIVKDHSTRRKLIEAGTGIIAEANDSELSTAHVLNDAERRIYDISINKTDKTIVHISEPLIAVHRRIGELISLKGKQSGITTGFRDLDKITFGWHKSDLVIIAARPAMGKTAFVLNLATNAALIDNAHVVIFSLEMTTEQLTQRMLCAESRVSMQDINAGTPTAEDLMSIAETVPRIEKGEIYIDDTPGVTVSGIRSRCRRLQAQHGLDIVIIDYLQLMNSESRVDNRVQIVAEQTRALKILARELNVTVILLSQLSRGPENRENHRPRMADLRESGAIEQDADIIAFLYRQAVYEENSSDNTAELIIAKHRNGPTDTVKLVWIPEYTRFSNMEYES